MLVADDEPVARLLLSAAVERLGHGCIVAEDGETAWRLYEEHQPEVVITDWEMPGLDGTELVRRIRTRALSPYTYLIVLTGLADEESARGVMQGGADEFATKPLEADDLERRLITAARVTALHRELHANARQDPLTGVANRLRLGEDLATLEARVRRYGHSYCVVLFDVDHFKAYNDLEGHLAGDSVLRRVAGALADALRGGDTLYRFGGEEFLALLPEQTLESATIAAERVRQSVERLALPHPAGGFVTVSCGVAELADVDTTAEALLRRADAALYRAKDAGRNRTEASSASD